MTAQRAVKGMTAQQAAVRATAERRGAHVSSLGCSFVDELVVPVLKK
jgi:hypothetical protein